MAKAETTPTTKLTRRAAMAAGLAAAAVPGSALAAEPDPTFAFIERHRRLVDELEALPDLDVERECAVGDKIWAAEAALIAAVPTTLAGLLAKVRYGRTPDPRCTHGSALLSLENEETARAFLLSIERGIENVLGRVS